MGCPLGTGCPHSHSPGPTRVQPGNGRVKAPGAPFAVSQDAETVLGSEVLPRQPGARFNKGNYQQYRNRSRASPPRHPDLVGPTQPPFPLGNNYLQSAN